MHTPDTQWEPADDMPWKAAQAPGAACGAPGAVQDTPAPSPDPEWQPL
jgi:hypothetical protein